jgi:hypothetical protein
MRVVLRSYHKGIPFPLWSNLEMHYSDGQVCPTSFSKLYTDDTNRQAQADPLPLPLIFATLASVPGDLQIPLRVARLVFSFFRLLCDGELD